MNLLKSLTGYFLGDQNKRELVQISGSFYDQYKGQWRCLFNDCTATILKSNRQYFYDLVIDRKFEEGEEIDDQESTEYVFSLLENIDFAKDRGPVNNGFSWINSEEKKRYLFEVDDCNDTMNDLFQLTAAQTLYEGKEQKSSKDVPAEELSHFVKEAPSISSVASPSVNSSTLPATPPKSSPSKLYPALTPPPQSSPYTPYKPSMPPPSTLSTTPSQVTQQTLTPSSIGTTSAASSTPSGQLQPSPAPASSSSSSKVTSPSVVDETVSAPPSQSRRSVEGENVHKVEYASLYIFDDRVKTFVEKERAVSVLFNFTGDDEEFRHILRMRDKELIFCQDINNDMFAKFSSKEQSIIWVYVYLGKVWTWSLKIQNPLVFRSFYQAFAKCLLEVNSNAEVKEKSEQTEFLQTALCEDIDSDVNKSYEQDDGTVDEVDMLDFSGLDIRDKEEQPEEEEEQEEEEEEEENDDDDEDGEEIDDENTKGSRNSSLAVGTKSNRAFVVRGSKIGVFKVTNDEKLKFSNTIKRIKNSKGELFSPRKLMLHEQDSNLIMLHPSDHRKIFSMDLNRDDIVEEWSVSENYGVNEVLPNTKYAQTTPCKTLVGLNDKGFFLLDPRMAGEKMVESRSYFYSGKTKPQLNCAATTGSGQVVVGSRRGEIRLFDHKMLEEGRSSKATALEDRRPRAKTSLPGFGDPITAIDVTEDGLWILATCKTYLLVIPTSMKDGGNGFEKRMGDEKPIPRRLQLKREDLVRMGGQVSFTPAHFNTSDPENPNAPPERSIVTSSGPFVITWNFRLVKRNVLNEYQIKQYDQTVVADQFKFGEDKSIIVTLPDNVLMAKKVARKVV